MKILMKTLVRMMTRTVNYMVLILFAGTVHAQQLTQTIRGTVVDKISQSPMPGAVVVLLGSTPLKGTATDVNGQFSLKDIPVGRQSIKVTFMGYKEAIIPNIAVNSGKEVVLNIQLEEQIVQANEAVVKAKVEKRKPLNELAIVSTRTFSVEETQKFAAAFNDPGRMATSFSGVVAVGDGNNTISIRGNSPNGLLWRMEGVDIPNPNHFSSVGTSGGGISILSAQLLGNSDFMTGAFAAEYGNALSGVFDLKLRKGNNQKREFTFQAGILGIDVASEGPIRKGYEGSYLINYRYSTLSLLSLVGLDVIGDATTNFQDLSFNVSLPTKKYGTFGVFGFGGLSSQTTIAERDSAVWKEDGFKQYQMRFLANTGTFGVNNTKLFGKKMVLKSTVLFSGTENAYKENKLDNNYRINLEEQESYVQSKLGITSTLTRKIDARNSIRTGFIVNFLNYDLQRKALEDSTNVMEVTLANSGSTSTIQTFAQWNHKLSERLTTNIGLHTLLLTLNNTYSIEPRASIKYDLSSKQYVSFGYGLHGQIQPLGTYFAKPNGSTELLNKNLGISKAHHYVLSHDISVSPHTHIKTEVYYQHLFNIPVSTDKQSIYSVLNDVEGFTDEQLANNGLGRNYGLELTVERFLHKNLYYLLSGSLYESKYKAPSGQWFNTRYNTNYALTFTAGKEWELSEKRKRKVLGINTKLVYVGGFRNTPIDIEASRKKEETVYINERAFSHKSSDYMRMDIRFSIKRNYAKTTTTLSLDLQNATNHQNVGGQYFDKNSQTIKNWYQAGLIPVLAYKIEF